MRPLIFALLAVQAFAAPNLPKLAEQLASSDHDQRRDAAHQAAALGVGAKSLLPQLINALDDSDNQVFSDSIAAIAAMGPDGKAAAPKLFELLESRKGRGFRPRDRDQATLRAAFALSKFGVSPELLAGLKSGDTGVRRGSAKALGFIGPDSKEAIPDLIENLGHEEQPLRADVVEALALIGSAAVEPLISSLGWPDPRVREGSARALGELRAGAEPMLRAAKEEKETPVLAAIIGAVPRVGISQESSVAILIEALCDKRPEIHRAAVDAFVLVRPAAPVAVPALVKLLNGANAESAAATLGFIGSEASAAAPALIAAAKRTTPPGKVFTDALSRLGAPVVPVLIAELQALPPKDFSGDHWAVEALRCIGGAAVPALAKQLDSPSPAVRLAAVKVLGAQGSGARSVQARLLDLAADPEPLVRAAVLSVLEPLGVPTARTVEFISQLVKDTDPAVRRAAAEAAITMGPAARPISKDLARLIDDKDATVRVAALRATGAVGGGIDSAELLSGHLGDIEMRPAVLDALVKLGASATPAVPKLLALFPSADPAARAQVLQIFAVASRDAASVLPVIEPALSAPEEAVRAAALDAFSLLQPNKDSSVAAGVTALKDPARVVREAAAISLARLGEGGNARAIPAIRPLIDMIQNESDHTYAMEALRAMRVKDIPSITYAFSVSHDEVRMWAAERAGRLGRESGMAFMPELDKLTASGNDGVRNAARRAIAALNR